MINPINFDFAGATQKIRDVMEFCGVVVATFSTLANLLPKWESVANPILQKVYRRFVAVVAALALNWRRHIPSLNLHIFAMKNHPPAVCPHCGAIDGAHDNLT
jgi:hypothetical protein